jgi:uncharacterized protein YndB with AHSA1/START domain
MQASEEARVTVQVYSIYIQASAQSIWDAITQPEWTRKYGYQAPQEFVLRPGGSYRARSNDQMKAMGLPETVIDGEVLAVEPPHRLVQTYRFLFDEATKSEGFSKLTWEIEPVHAKFCKLTLTHEMENAPMMAAMVSSTFSEQGAGGWLWILSDMKSLLETGHTLASE